MLRIAGLIALALWLTGTGLWLQYDRTRPITASVPDGRIYRLNTHGHIVFLTMAEYTRLYGLLGIGLVGGLCVILMSPRRPREGSAQ
jgi:hypothetical protein